MKLNDHIVLWNHVFIQVMDVRHKKMDKGEELRSYRLPVSAFLYTARGSARVWLDDSVHRVDRFHVLHGGKGMCLSVLTEDVLEYYIILYKATLALPSRKELVQLLERENPFQNQYAFAPHYPLPLYDKVKLLEQEWYKGSGLGKLHVKALFHHFVFELLHQLDRQGIQPLKPDLVAQAVTYIREHFSRPITLESIAEDLECSTGHLSRLFKSKMHTSPIHYLGQIRANRTAELLMQTDATLQEIAERVGYPDAHSLSVAASRNIRDYLLYDSKKNGSSISRDKIRICPKRSLNMPFSGQPSHVILILIINIGIMRKGIFSCTVEAK